jgi:hypothetical protein
MRNVAIDAETVAILRTHRKQQRELMMANRKVYQNFDLVFAKEHADLQSRRHNWVSRVTRSLTHISIVSSRQQASRRSVCTA